MALGLGICLVAGCGGSAVDSTAGTASATMACQQLIGLEAAIDNGQVNNQIANQALDSAKINADQAAAEDPRWQRLDTDVSTVLTDLEAKRTATLKAAVLDAAAICSPLSTTTTTLR